MQAIKASALPRHGQHHCSLLAECDDYTTIEKVLDYVKEIGFDKIDTEAGFLAAEAPFLSSMMPQE